MTEACSEVECLTDTDCTSVMSESDSQPEYLMSSPRVASIVRKELAIAIRDLMQHGLITVSEKGPVASKRCQQNSCPLSLKFISHCVTQKKKTLYLPDQSIFDKIDLL